jgi:simple sugar transport system substrate-binding protein
MKNGRTAMHDLLHPIRRPTRRRVLQGIGGAALATSAIGPLGARRAHAADLTVGFIYVGPKDDYGYNQAHAEGAAVLKEIEGVTLIEEENVPETVDVEKSMER